jgi:hypothetical protein
LGQNNATQWYNDNYPRFQVHKNVSVSPFSHISTGFFLDTTTPIASQDPEAILRQNVYYKNETDRILKARDIIFGNRGHDENTSTNSVDSITTCFINMEYVEARVFCNRLAQHDKLSCRIVALRPSQRPHLSSNWTELDVPPGQTTMGFFPYIFGSQHVDTSTPTEVFMSDPPTAFTKANLLGHPVILSRVPIDVFENRLGLVFNTFFNTVLSPTTVVGGQTNRLDGGDSVLLNSTGIWTYQRGSAYKVHWGWLVIYLLAVLVLCVNAIWAVVVRFSLHIPEILGNVSSLTRDSLFIAVPAGGSIFDGDERARILKGLWLRVQDVDQNSEVGRIALSSDSSLRDGQIGRSKLYQ